MEYPTDNECYYCCPYTKARGFTKLMHIVINMKEYKNYDYLEAYLKEHPNEIDKQNEKGWTALMLCAANYESRCTLKTIEILVNAGCNLNMVNENGCTALIIACMCNNYEAIKLLINSGCDLNVRRNDSLTAISLTCFKGDYTSTELLVNAGCELNIMSKSRDTPLMLCWLQADTNIVKLLIDAGCDLYTEDNDYRTALEIFCIYDDNPHRVKNIETLIDAQYNLYSHGTKHNLMSKAQYISQTLSEIGYIFYDNKVVSFDIFENLVLEEEWFVD